MKTNIPTNTPLIFLNLENRNFLIILHTKIPKLNDKKNIDIDVKNAAREWYYTKSNIDTVKIIFEMLMAVSETN